MRCRAWVSTSSTRVVIYFNITLIIQIGHICHSVKAQYYQQIFMSTNTINTAPGQHQQSRPKSIKAKNYLSKSNLQVISQSGAQASQLKERVAHPSQVIKQGPKKSSQNDNYLWKWKSTRKVVANEGIFTYSPEKAQCKVEMKGFNHFTNIYLKRIEKQSNKVSFSQFMQIKKEKDFESKFKFIFPKKNSYNLKSKSEVAQSVEPFGLNKNEEGRKMSKNSVQQNRRALARSRFREPSKVFERYPSNLSQSMDLKGSLQISRVQMMQVVQMVH